MIELSAKRDALLQLARLVPDRPPITLLCGFLLGRLDRVHFVERPDGAGAYVELSLRSHPLVAQPPFRGTVGGVDVTHPMAFIDGLLKKEAEIGVSCDFPGRATAEWYRRVLIRSIDDEEGPRVSTIEGRLARLRARVDHCLDIYAECQQALQGDAGNRRQQLEFFLERARNEMQGLSREIQRLESQLQAQERGPLS